MVCDENRDRTMCKIYIQDLSLHTEVCGTPVNYRFFSAILKIKLHSTNLSAFFVLLFVPDKQVKTKWPKSDVWHIIMQMLVGCRYGQKDMGIPEWN